MSRSQFDLVPFLNLYLDKEELALDASILESALANIESNTSSMRLFLDALMHSRLWQGWNFESNPYIEMILAVGEEIDRLATLRNEPAYHSRQHMMDVCFMLSYLLQQEKSSTFEKAINNPWTTSTQEKWLLLLAAAAHDLGHSGLVNSSPYELEQQSLDLLRACLNAKGIDPALIEKSLRTIEPWILNTDHAQYSALLSRLEPSLPKHADCMAMLLVESDLASSALPERGQILTNRLGDEWAGPYPEKSIALRNQVGYLSFLASLRFSSPQADNAHIPQFLNQSLLQLRSHLS